MTTVTPAYGRDYKSKQAALADWNSNEDFIINDMSNRWDGKPVNKQGAEEYKLSIMIRYDQLRKITNV